MKSVRSACSVMDSGREVAIIVEYTSLSRFCPPGRVNLSPSFRRLPVNGLSRSTKDPRCPDRFFLCSVVVLLLLMNACAYHVNSLVDAPDAKPGDGKCESAEGLCTLRAAVMEAKRTV